MCVDCPCDPKVCDGSCPGECGGVEAAALTEQIAELLFQHQISKADSNWYGCTCGTPLAWNGVTNTQSHRAHLAGVLAARLADSRPVVSEGAVRESLAREIEAERYKRPTAWCEDFERGLDRAAFLVRGDRLSPTGDDSE